MPWNEAEQGPDELTLEDLEAEQAVELPPREAMSLITPMPMGSLVGLLSQRPMPEPLPPEPAPADPSV